MVCLPALASRNLALPKTATSPKQPHPQNSHIDVEMYAMVNARQQLRCVLSLAGVFGCLLPVDDLRAQTNASHSRRTVSISNCRITVIHDVKVGTERSGVLRSVDVRIGDTVQQGQILATLRDEVAQFSLKVRAKEASDDIELRFAQKVGELARLEYVKALELNKEIPNAHSELKLRSLRLAADRSLLQIEQSEHRRELAQLRYAEASVQLKSYIIRAPFDGIVKRVHKFNGEAVREGDTVVEIANYDRLRVEADCDLHNAMQLERGQPVQIEMDLPGLDPPVHRTRFPGRIVFVDFEVQDVSQKVQVWADVENHEKRLRAGLTATMHVTGRGSPSAGIPARPAPLVKTAE